jgi:hypothetical protein
VDAGVGYFEVDFAASGEPGVGEVFHYFMLRVDCDCFTAGEIREIYSMSAAAEAQVHSVVHQPFALQSIADAGFFQQVHGALFQNTGADALLHILAAAIFEDDGFDAVEVQQVRENQTRWPGSDDANLRAHRDASSRETF